MHPVIVQIARDVAGTRADVANHGGRGQRRNKLVEQPSIERLLLQFVVEATSMLVRYKF